MGEPMMTKRASGQDDRLARIHQQLTAAVTELTRSDAWARMLQVAARFPTYSPSNVLLIAVQRSDATNVAGLRTWNALGRRVRKGEKGIAILAPCLYKNRADVEASDETIPAREGPAEGESSRVLRGFRVVHVFDVSQTEGEPLPMLTPTQLKGAAPQQLWESLAGVVEREGFRLERGPCGGANGHTRFDDRVVRVREDVDPAQACKTLAHEIGHIRADHQTRFGGHYHASVGCRGLAEVEAESIAFVVSAASGMDSGDYTIPYVAGWANGDVDLLKRTATCVLTVSRGILSDAGLSPDRADAALKPASRSAFASGIDVPRSDRVSPFIG